MFTFVSDDGFAPVTLRALSPDPALRGFGDRAVARPGGRSGGSLQAVLTSPLPRPFCARTVSGPHREFPPPQTQTGHFSKGCWFRVKRGV